MSMMAIYTNLEVLEKMEGVEGQLGDVLSDYYRRGWRATVWAEAR
jgi:hypothetical protein